MSSISFLKQNLLQEKLISLLKITLIIEIRYFSSLNTSQINIHGINLRLTNQI